jgi:hypothetical protein
MDEKGFAIGRTGAKKRIVTTKWLKSRRVLGAVQDGNREWISIIACISATGIALPPLLIYRSDSGDFQKAWLQDYDSSKHLAYFATSQSGWTFEEIGVTWLKQVFLRHTKCGNEWRLLIVDGHSSHLNMAFITICEEEKVILAILPPHSTHRLQPLDVGVFSPLAKAYSDSLDRFIQHGNGWEKMNKANFWAVFYPAWCEALTAKNIKSAFEATGIHPFRPDAVLQHLTIDPNWEEIEQHEPQIQTIDDIYTLRQYSKQLDMTDPAIKLLCASLEKATISFEIEQHINKQLKETLLNLKTRQAKAGGMNLGALIPPGEAKKGYVFSPSKIQASRDRDRAKMEELDQKRQEKIQKTALREAQKAQKELETIAKREKMAERKKLSDENKRLKAAQLAAKNQAKEDARLQKAIEKEHIQAQKAQKSQKKSIVTAKKRLQRVDKPKFAELPAEPESERTAKSGRAIHRLWRYR